MSSPCRARRRLSTKPPRCFVADYLSSLEITCRAISATARSIIDFKENITRFLMISRIKNLCRVGRRRVSSTYQRDLQTIFHKGPQLYRDMQAQMNESTITCPTCGFQKAEQMPTDSCVFFYECTNCEQLLKPRRGDCCVFCSFGSIACPPKTNGASCC